jgi:hypothetical protein
MPAVQIWVLCSWFERLIGHATGTKGSAVYKRADRERSQLEHDATSGRHAAAMIGLTGDDAWRTRHAGRLRLRSEVRSTCGNRCGGRVLRGPHPPLKAIQCSFRERRQGMSVSEETQVEPGTAKRGDLGVLRLRLRSRRKMTRTAASIPDALRGGRRRMDVPDRGTQKTDFRGLEPGEEVPGGLRRIKGN